MTRLSPYLRHGLLDLAEVRDAALAAVARAGDAYRLIQELAWRDYWRRVYGAIGDRIHDDLHASKTGHPPAAYASELPEDIRDGTTGLMCIDAFTAELRATGYVHNHARMWFASYVVHHRRVAWQAGARFYLAHLLDGDPASNSLSWQWVASTFGAKPYIFNRENLERYAGEASCARCPLARGGCPFDAGYDELAARLFVTARANGDAAPPLVLRAEPDLPPATPPAEPAIVWVHPDALGEANAARRALPDAPAIVAGVDAMAARDGWDAHRTAFVAAAIDEQADLRHASAAERAADAIVAFAREHHATAVVTVASPDPLLRAIAADVAREIEIVVLDPPAFVRVERAVSLGRFRHYWKHVEASAMTATVPGDDRMQPRRPPAQVGIAEQVRLL